MFPSESFFEVTIRCIDNKRVVGVTRADSIQELLEKLKGTRIHFIHNIEPEHQSFTIYSHTIQRVDYKKIPSHSVSASTYKIEGDYFL